jgi:hypothetical protein
MTAPTAGSRVTTDGVGMDLRRVLLDTIRSRALRGPDRDLWADAAALWERLTESRTGLENGEWHASGEAPSDAGGPPWSLAEHVGHIADWQELAVVYTARAIDIGEWPSDRDYDDGNFDTYNEGRREPWASSPSDEIIARLTAARTRLLALAHDLTPATIREDEPWDWIYPALHGHYLDHLAVIEPWVAELRRRQTAPT